jgi:hypothetical protein
MPIRWRGTALGGLVLLSVAGLWACSGSSQDEVKTQRIAAGGTHTCVLTDGDVSCWGNNFYGQLGTDELADVIPVRTKSVDLGERAVDLAVGDAFSCAVVESGKVFCWGENRFGHLGADTQAKYSRVPAEVVGIDAAVAVGAGDHHACAVLDNGALRCWGWNYSGQLGNGKAGENAFAPEKVGGLQNVRQVDGGMNHTCAVTNAGEVFCWGSNILGSLGDGSQSDRLRPVKVAGLPGPARSVALGAGHTCAILEDGRAFCWGANAYGQMGNGRFSRDTELNAAPQPVGNIDEIAGLTAGDQHTCAFAEKGPVYCWGSNSGGQIGALGEMGCFLQAFTCQLDPIAVAQLLDDEPPVSISAGFNHTCVLYKDGASMCWGGNGVGQLGDGSTVDSLEPVTTVGEGTLGQ